MIASGASLEGSLQSDGDIHVEGRVHGAVESASVVSVGAGGAIQGDVLADEVTVGGRIEGTVIAASRLHMLATGVIQGDARYGTLQVDRGGQIEGRTLPIGAAGIGGPTSGKESTLADDVLVELPAPPAAALEPAARPATPPLAAPDAPPRDSTPPPLPAGATPGPSARPAPPARVTARFTSGPDTTKTTPPVE